VLDGFDLLDGVVEAILAEGLVLDLLERDLLKRPQATSLARGGAPRPSFVWDYRAADHEGRGPNFRFPPYGSLSRRHQPARTWICRGLIAGDLGRCRASTPFETSALIFSASRPCGTANERR
jgi:hypothetical protein